MSSKPVCTLVLDDDKVMAFGEAIKSHYWYELFLDDLPIWGFVGESKKDTGNTLIYTHKKLDISYNLNRVFQHCSCFLAARLYSISPPMCCHQVLEGYDLKNSARNESRVRQHLVNTNTHGHHSRSRPPTYTHPCRACTHP